MALMYQMDRPNGLVTITGEYATSDEWLALCTAILRDPQFRPGFSFIRDMRGAVPPARDETVFETYRVVQQFWDRLEIRRAALVTEVAIFKLAHALAVEQALSARPVRAFTQYDDAIRWLQESDGGAATAASDR